MLLVPSVFHWPGVAVQDDPPHQPLLIFPARGIGRLWEALAPSGGQRLGVWVPETRPRLGPARSCCAA